MGWVGLGWDGMGKEMEWVLRKVVGLIPSGVIQGIALVALSVGKPKFGSKESEMALVHSIDENLLRSRLATFG